MNWASVLEQTGAEELVDGLNVGWLFEGEQSPSEKDRAVAWELYIELRTRISTQPLHFLDGDEAAALGSLYSLFQLARDLLKKQGHECWRTAAVTEAVLNNVVRPFTAEWHQRNLAGEFTRDDACREFRAKLRGVQFKLGQFEKLLYAIACDQIVTPDSRSLSGGRPVEFGTRIAFDRLLGLKDPMAGASAADEMVNAERQEIENRRTAVDLEIGSDDLVGMSISGGGIRSATFALGVVQGLVTRGILRHVDVLSTVSGGGYLGSFLSSMLNTDSNECGPQRDRAPFKPDIAGDSSAIRFLRNHSRYILPSSFPRWLRTAGQAAYGMLSNLVILSTIVLLSVLLTDGFLKESLSRLYTNIRENSEAPTDLWAASAPTIWIWFFSALSLFLLPLAQKLGRLGGKYSGFASCWEWMTVWAFAGSVLVAMIDYLPLFHFGYLTLMHAIGDRLLGSTNGWSMTATGVTLANVAGLLAARSEWLSSFAKSMPRIGKILFGLLWMSGPALLVYMYFELCRIYVATAAPSVPQISWLPIELTATGLLWSLLTGSVVYSALTNVNFTSLHRYYRNRLSETYLLQQRNQNVIEHIDRQPLSKLRESEQSTAPYHLINAALNLPSSDVAELRGRDCDFFLFSKHRCGSPVLGYHSTRQWEAADASLDLATAVAISGAAAAPQMGMGSIKGASFLLTLLNVRLGYWLQRPLPLGSEKTSIRALSAPGPSYLLREAFNKMDHRSRYVNVSDGGHIENLAMYELLRRRCRYVVAVDGECDPEMVFPSLMRLQQFAAVDMDIHIEMDLGRLRWNELTSTPEQQSQENEDTESSENSRYSRGHYAVGRINYPDGVTGWLIYVKLSVTGNEPEYVLDYRRRHPDFPHESTADQMFEEDQFEAYRRLGQHITDDLFSDELLSEEARTRANNCQLDVRNWYQEIVNCFFKQTTPPLSATASTDDKVSIDPAK
ncbi:MAG: hypothetical protein H8E66_31270 [Planctomycetes bacterium]|nr:hypothetical protein [Planctomycetota bacterium]